MFCSPPDCYAFLRSRTQAGVVWHRICLNPVLSILTINQVHRKAAEHCLAFTIPHDDPTLSIDTAEWIRLSPRVVLPAWPGPAAMRADDSDHTTTLVGQPDGECCIF